MSDGHIAVIGGAGKMGTALIEAVEVASIRAGALGDDGKGR